MGKATLLLIGVFSAAVLGTALAAADGPKEIDTALAHAQMAAAATDLNGVHMHLHHVVNCLVGPTGKSFDASAGNPCKDMGNGALNDNASDKSLHSDLEGVLHEAERGLKDRTYSGAKRVARNVAARLKMAAKAK